MDRIQAKKIVVAYSGGLDTSVIIKWLREHSDAEVVAFTADIGQGEELAPLDEKAKKTGASKLIIDDLREEFVRDFVFPALRANAIYEGVYLLGTSLARPLIGKYLVKHAKAEGADAICHGATGKGNDQVRFELTAYALMPEIKVVAPWRVWDLKGRADLIAYCEQHQIPVTATKEKPYSTDRNLFHISFEGGVLEDPWFEPKDEMFVMSTSPEKAPDKAEYVEIDFHKGNPVAVNGQKLGPVELLTKLNELGGKHGVGRVDVVENRYVGMKSRGVYETPGGTILHVAHRGVEQLTMDREVMHLRDSLIPRYAELIYNGYWYAPERESLQVMIDQMQEHVTGTARIKLYKGTASLAGRKAERSLFSAAHASFEAENVYQQADAEGFIKLNALRLRLRAQRLGK
ncbi:MAG: argininosuccinate synthase [Deltaproteobacteria bacterium]|jgi:argininosuccinate synthase|nr:argininosuccinate synthase [Deltaproteobacteria bacterium]